MLIYVFTMNNFNLMTSIFFSLNFSLLFTQKKNIRQNSNVYEKITELVKNFQKKNFDRRKTRYNLKKR